MTQGRCETRKNKCEQVMTGNGSSSQGRKNSAKFQPITKSTFREHSREESDHIKSHSPAVHGPFLACSSLVSSRDFPHYQMGSRK